MCGLGCRFEALTTYTEAIQKRYVFDAFGYFNRPFVVKVLSVYWKLQSYGLQIENWGAFVPYVLIYTTIPNLNQHESFRSRLYAGKLEKMQYFDQNLVQVVFERLSVLRIINFFTYIKVKN